MKVIHIESGLGNQMLSYCELLALKSIHPEDNYYLETLVYDFPDAEKVIKQWQGYELERIFGINTANIREYFTKEEWEKILEDVRYSKFWDKNWNWPVYICEAFNRQGLKLHNLRGNFETKAANEEKSIKGKLRNNLIYQEFQKTWLYSNLRTWNMKFKDYTENDKDYLYYKGTEDILTGQKLSFMYRNNDIEKIDDLIRKTFIFPQISDDNNRKILEIIKKCQSVAIHARRGDLLGLNGRYYKGGYFKRAVKYIKSQISDPVFFFFCDPGSIEWCRQNQRIFALDFAHDNVFFVDWNKGNDSFRDMQLMSYCKHNIITISSFGWWGAYLNTNPEKITISPEININTTHHF